MKSNRHRSPRNETMKCVKVLGSGIVLRLRNEDAEAMVKDGRAKYTKKSEFRAMREKI